MSSLVNTEVKPFKATAFHNGKFVDVTEANLKGKWSVVIFMPAAFTFNCPTEVEDAADHYAEFQKIFGSYTDESYVPFTAEEYLRNGDTLTVVRLLYEDGYSYKNAALAVIASSGSGAGLVKAVTHLLHPTQTINYTNSTTNVFQESTIGNYQSGSFNLKISGSFSERG